MTETASTWSAVQTYQLSPEKPHGRLNVTVEVDEAGAVHLIPNDALAAFVLHERMLNQQVSGRMRGVGGVDGKWQFEALVLSPDTSRPTLSKDGTSHTTMKLGYGDYEPLRNLANRLSEARAKKANPQPKKRGGKRV